jgi:LPS sulfotransferase NodH
MHREFLIFSTQRSGSTWLVDLLNSHPAIRTYSELFLDSGRGSRFAGAKDCSFFNEYLERAEHARPGDANLEPLLSDYLDTVFRSREGVEAIGFKLMYGQFGAYPELQELLSRRGVAVIHLIRDNLLDLLISKQTAVARDLFHARGDVKVSPVHIRVNIGALEAHLRDQEDEVERARCKLDALGWPTLETRYESLVSDPGAFGGLLRFLGVSDPDRPLISELRKINTPNQKEIVENYDEMAKKLSGTRYDQFLRPTG